MLLYSIALYRIEILHDVFFTLALRSAMSMISIAEYLVQTISVTGVLRWYYWFDWHWNLAFIWFAYTIDNRRAQRSIWQNEKHHDGCSRCQPILLQTTWKHVEVLSCDIWQWQLATVRVHSPLSPPSPPPATLPSPPPYWKPSHWKVHVPLPPCPLSSCTCNALIVHAQPRILIVQFYSELITNSIDDLSFMRGYHDW